MTDSHIEAIIGSPPERDELVVQLFALNGGQWAEIFRKHGTYLIELYGFEDGPVTFGVDEFISAIQRSLVELKQRLEGEG